MVTNARVREINAFIDQQEEELLEEPVQLNDIRARMTAIEAFAGNDLLKRSVVGRIAGRARHYYPLPEWIALHHREMDIYHEHVRKGDFDSSNYRNVRVGAIFELCECWMTRNHRYPYGDVRLLRPFIEALFEEAASWPSVPYPMYTEPLQRWYQELAPGGALYPSDEHLAYVERFEAFAEDIIWDSREQAYITIANFPAPPKVWPPDRWWCTQHVLAKS